MKTLLALSVATLALVPPAFAIEDEATGLAVTLPAAEFKVEPSTLSGGYTANFGVTTVSGKPALVGGKYLCEVGFQAAPQNAELTQAEINAHVETPDWLQLAQQSMAVAFEFAGSEQFELAGATGVEFIAIPKAPDGADIRVVLSMLETPRGRTAISCATDTRQLEEALPVFRAIRAGVTPPA